MDRNLVSHMGTVGLEPTRLAAPDPKSCASASFATSPSIRAQRRRPIILAWRGIWPSAITMHKFRLPLERLGLLLITIIALGAPLALGFFSYLALNDGIDLNASDSLHASRIWLVRENRRFTALAISTRSGAAATDDAPDLQCARTYFTALHWSPKISLERVAGACTCYTRVDDTLREATAPCAN